VTGERMLQFFRTSHLRPDVAAVAAPFGTLAEWIVVHVPKGPERTVSLRSLLDAKDNAVRAVIAEKDDA
jgi:hypothetical protein